MEKFVTGLYFALKCVFDITSSFQNPYVRDDVFFPKVKIFVPLGGGDFPLLSTLLAN